MPGRRSGSRPRLLALDAQEFDARLPVWTALSLLYLDTLLQDDDIASIAWTLDKHRLESEAAERILRDEVHPAFRANL